MQKRMLVTMVFFWVVFMTISGQTAAGTPVKGNTAIPAVIEQKNTDINKNLADLLEIENQGDWHFLTTLSDTEQLKLAERIAYLLDEEGGIVTSLLVTGTKILPNFIVVTFAHRLEPKTVAKLSNKLPVKTAARVTKGLDREFLAEVTNYLTPQKASAIIEECPVELVTDVSRRLMANNEDKVLARLADYLSPEKLREISQSLTPEENVRIANQMNNRSLISKILVTFPDDYMMKLIKESFRLESYELVADVTAEMENERLLDILGQMEQDDEIPKSVFLAEVSVYLDPVKTAAMVEDVPDELLVAVNRHLVIKDAYTVMAGMADHFPAEKLLMLSKELSPHQNVQVANQMKNRLVIARLLSSFSDDYVIEMTKACFNLGYTELVLELMNAIDKDRLEKIVNDAGIQNAVSPEFLELIR